MTSKHKIELATLASKRRFILENTAIMSPPHVPEIKLHLADEAHDLWHKTEEALEEIGLPPPFWAFAWAGGQGLARYILDHNEIVSGKTILDLASGSGLVAIAAKLAGAASVTANDIDPFCQSAIELNDETNQNKSGQYNNNQCQIEFCGDDFLSGQKSACGFDVILAGDIFYEKPLAEAALAWFGQQAKRGVKILIGDPGRAYLPKDHLSQLAEYQVKVTRALEDAEIKRTIVWELSSNI